MWYQAVSLRSTSGSHLGILPLYKSQVQWYLGWGRGQKLNHKVTKWDKGLSPWETLQSMWSTSPQLWTPTRPREDYCSQTDPRATCQPGNTLLVMQTASKSSENVCKQEWHQRTGSRHIQGTSLTTDWLSWWSWALVQGQLTQPCSKAGTEGLKVWPPTEVGNKRFIMEVKSIHRRGRKKGRCMKMYEVRSRVPVHPLAEVFVPSQEQEEDGQRFIRLAYEWGCKDSV